MKEKCRPPTVKHNSSTVNFRGGKRRKGGTTRAPWRPVKTFHNLEKVDKRTLRITKKPTEGGGDRGKVEKEGNKNLKKRNTLKTPALSARAMLKKTQKDEEQTEVMRMAKTRGLNDKGRRRHEGNTPAQ